MKEFALSIINPTGTPPTTLSLPEGASNLQGINAQSIISTGVSFLLLLAIFASLLYVILGGMELILAQGEKQSVQNARNKITMAIIGLVVALTSFLVVGLIGDLFGGKLLGPFS